jgi:hypothetical protein
MQNIFQIVDFLAPKNLGDLRGFVKKNTGGRKPARLGNAYSAVAWRAGLRWHASRH